MNYQLHVTPLWFKVEQYAKGQVVFHIMLTMRIRIRHCRFIRCFSFSVAEIVKTRTGQTLPADINVIFWHCITCPLNSSLFCAWQLTIRNMALIQKTFLQRRNRYWSSGNRNSCLPKFKLLSERRWTKQKNKSKYVKAMDFPFSFGISWNIDNEMPIT